MPREHDDTATETDAASMFRAEALEHRQRPERRGDVVRFAPPWTGVVFWVLIGSVLAALAAASIVRIDTEIRGIAALDERGRVVVLLPAALAPRVAPGDAVRLGDTGAEAVSSGEVIDPAGVKERYGVDVAAASLPLVTSASGRPGMVGTSATLVDSEPVIVALVPGLRALIR